MDINASGIYRTPFYGSRLPDGSFYMRPGMRAIEQVAYCGLICEGCPIFWATREPNAVKQAKMRAAIVRLCGESHDSILPTTECISCEGCRTEGGKLFGGCGDCRFRVCAREKKIESCAFCAEFACDELRKFFQTNPDARTRLEVMRSAR